MQELYSTRSDLLSIIPENSIILEIGVFRGEFAEELLETNPKELYLVDIWTGGWGSGDKDGNNHHHIDDMLEVYLNLTDKYKTFSEVKVIRSPSTSFLNWCEPNTFDVIYVDGDHEAPAVYGDMVNSLTAIKNNGWLMGHDYHGQVRYAVDKFCIDYDQVISHVTQDGCPSFAIKILK
jgi:Methyltransferase domain